MLLYIYYSMDIPCCASFFCPVESDLDAFPEGETNAWLMASRGRSISSGAVCGSIVIQWALFM